MRKGGFTTPNSLAMTPKPGEIIGPQAPTTAVSIQIINSIKSFFHRGQFNGSRGESLGCGTRMISLSFPVPCFRCAVPETKARVSIHLEKSRNWSRRGGRTIVQVLEVSSGEDFGEGSSPRDMLQIFIIKNSKTHLKSQAHFWRGENLGNQRVGDLGIIN
jgi:hypothetical protein